MTSDRLLDLLRLLVREPLALFWTAAAWLLDYALRLDPLEAAGVAILLLAIPGLLAWGLQRRWNARVDEHARRGGGRIGLREAVRLEVSHSPLFLPFKPLQLLVRGFLVLGTGLASLRRRLLRKPAGATGEERPPEPPLLVATLGPSFLLGGVIATGTYLAGRIAGPLVAAELGLSPGLSPWEYLIFGGRPELAWLLPLERHPYVAVLLALVFWLALWWAAALSVRLARVSDLGGNLVAKRQDPGVLAGWRGWAGAPELWRPAGSYRGWATWVVVAILPLLAWAWLHVGSAPYRADATEVALVAVLWLAWLLHILLAGVLRAQVSAAAEEALAGPTGHGWWDVVAHLESELQVDPPDAFPVEPAAEPAVAATSVAAQQVLSPLIRELLERTVGENGVGAAGDTLRLTRMQQEVLTTLALQGYVHTDPPVSLERLSLGSAEGEAIEDRSGLRSRNQVVLAPEGWGKTTLVLLAVANHALVHTRGSLVVTATPARATELAARLRRAVEPSTLRWNLRVREPGPDLMNDLSRGIVPDVVITSLHDLTATLLDRTATFAPVLRNLGLLVVDDVEAFAGPVEVHAQLAFRRLVLRVEELLGVEELGGAELAAPQVLILGSDAMDETSEWAQSLCGVEAVTRRFGGAEDVAESPAGAPATHLVYRLRDFRSPTGEALEAAELVAACEAMAVPWCYRLCGDGRRELGRGPLLLPDEPRHATEHPEEACVLLLEGTWSEVRRERSRLRRAGTRFATSRGRAVGEPIALITLIEPDLEMALTQLDERFPLSPVLRDLPRPVLRPPTGLAVLPHLSAELTQHWTEVADVVRMFGTPAADVLRDLARDGLLEAEEQQDVAAKANEYVRRVHVKALARAVNAGGGGSRSGLGGSLPPKVSQVALVSGQPVAVRDRTSLTTLAEIDGAGAHFVYYPGRIFKDARGIFVVVEHVAYGSGEAPGVAGDVLVEPLLGDSISSPRRRLHLEMLDPTDLADGGAQLRQAAGGDFFGPDPVLVGRHPLELALRPVRIWIDHLATYRLGPVHGEIRQRSLVPSRIREELGRRRLETVALAIHPNPRLGDAGDDGDDTLGPELTLDTARLLAAVLRAVLPTMVRGAAEAVGVALQVAGPTRDLPDDHRLGTADAVILFDADAGGNGAARSIYRDGVDTLLRLCRLVVERVLSLDRLLALHDEWATLEEVLAEGRGDLGGRRNVESLAAERRERGQDLRRRLLEWLDSRLRPEGGSEAQRELETRFASGFEAGEGDVTDLGRCWASAEGAVGDLLWAKHRWHRTGGEALLDVGFDRTLLVAGRSLAAGTDGRLDAYGRLLDERRSAEGEANDLAPVTVALPEGHGTTPGPEAEALYRHLWALAGDARGALAPLADRLRADWEERGRGGGSLGEALRRFVLGIPANRRTGVAGAEAVFAHPASPFETLLTRQGSEIEKALLLALLLERCGLPSGCFVSFAEGRAAGALPDLDTESGSGEPPFQAEPASGGGRLLPIAVDRPLEVGRIEVHAPASWVYLPLTDLPPRLVPDRSRRPPMGGEAEDQGGTGDA